MDRYGPAVLRAICGVMFVAHGTQKLFGWFGGAGLPGTASGFEASGLAPGFPLAVAVGVTETAGGLLLLAGAATRYAASALIVVMLGAIWNVHLAHGFFLNWSVTAGRGHGVEYNLVIIGALLSLVLTGPGALSIDDRRVQSARTAAANRARLLRKL